MIEPLNERFAQPGTLEFVRGRGDLPLARVTTPHGRGEVYLHGAHVTSWQPVGAEDLLWVSESSRYAEGKAIRGGIPICWPWFGDDASGQGRPAHGFARTQAFAVTRGEVLDDGSCVLELCLEPSEVTRVLWPEDFRLTLTATFGAELDLRLGMENRSDRPVTHTAALHSYLRVGDVGRVQLAGFAGGEYLDKVRGFARDRQDEEPRIDGEIDRVYLQTREALSLVDPVMQRTLRVTKVGSHTTVLWNPGPEHARQMADLDDEGYRNMLCIEAANAHEDEVALQPGQSHVLGTTLSLS
ncbi:MAG: D-hexose-6-phosphate mutarotase [Planctomycetota bacterium]|nr:D-hexose-6-phosphate mutarotase [Planctomycetota bacterium]